MILKHQKRNIVLIILLFGLCINCNYPIAKFGSDTNIERERVGLESIPKDWQAISIGQNYTVWKNPMGDELLRESKPVFFSKSVKYNNQKEIVAEEDLYYSGKKFSTIDGHESEIVSIKYFFLPQTMGDIEVTGWYCTYLGPEKNDTDEENVFVPKSISLNDADLILKKWGLILPIRK